MREEAATILECPEIVILVHPLNCTVFDPFVQTIRVATSTIFFFNRGYEPSDASMNSLRHNCPLALGRLGPLRKQTKSLQALRDGFSRGHGADLSNMMRVNGHV